MAFVMHFHAAATATTTGYDERGTFNGWPSQWQLCREQ